MIPGKLIARTPDSRFVVVLRGDSLDVVPLELRTAGEETTKGPRRGTRGHSARLRAVVEQWSSRSQTDTLGVYSVEVRDGDWLPDWSGNATRCGRGMRVRRVVSPSQVEIEYPPGALWIAPPALTEGLALVTSGAATTLGTRSFDAGRFIRLSIAP